MSTSLGPKNHSLLYSQNIAGCLVHCKVASLLSEDYVILDHLPWSEWWCFFLIVLCACSSVCMYFFS